MFDIDKEQVTSNMLSVLEVLRLSSSDGDTDLDLWSTSLGLPVTSVPIENLSVAIPVQTNTQETVNLVSGAVRDEIQRSIILPMFIAHAALLNMMIHNLQECSGKSREEILNELELAAIE